MNSDNTSVEITNQLKDIVKHKAGEYQAKLGLIRLSHPDIEIPPTSNDEGFWAAGHDSLNPHGTYAKYKGQYTCKEEGNFTIKGTLGGLVFGGSSSGAAVLCVYNTMPSKFFDTKLWCVYSSGVATYTMDFFYKGLLLASSAGPQFGNVATLMGHVKATIN